jgi:beta-N-acetylglucosaminidase
MIDNDRMKTLKIEQNLLTVKHIRQLESEIEKLMKQKAILQDQVDAFYKSEQKQMESVND